MPMRDLIPWGRQNSTAPRSRNSPAPPKEPLRRWVLTRPRAISANSANSSAAQTAPQHSRAAAPPRSTGHQNPYVPAVVCPRL